MSAYGAFMAESALHDLDVLELSTLAWGIADPEGLHEAEEQVWTAALARGWPPLGSTAELRSFLDSAVQALLPPAPSVPLTAVAALMVFLAAHPDRRQDGDSVLAAALHEAFGDELPPPAVSAWLTERRSQSTPRARHHGAVAERRRFHSRPSGFDSGS